jgi:diaminobutyrate-2-oxoglutarate transaminase
MENAIESMESEVRYYSRVFPAIFKKATGSFVFDREGRKYLDFFCGSGSLNYGHSNPVMKRAVIDYLEADGIINSLDQMTEAKLGFMKCFYETILKQGGYRYKLQFCGPTGTNSVEAAIKLARKFTGREKIVYFEHSFHGMTYGSMSVSGIRSRKLNAAYTMNTVQMPFAENPESLDMLRTYLRKCMPEDRPAGLILETIQAEGGIRVAPIEWVEAVSAIAREFGVLLIIDDIQTGCGRTGLFFSFAGMDVRPDIVCLSKSLSGYGFPFSMNLIRPELDCWSPAEHNGTFRGNNLAFISATCALLYWKTAAFSQGILQRAELIDRFFAGFDYLGKLKGRGLMRGIELQDAAQTSRLQKTLFRNGILMDTCGYEDNVVKIMPPLTISEEDLRRGLDIIRRSMAECSIIAKHDAFHF